MLGRARGYENNSLTHEAVVSQRMSRRAWITNGQLERTETYGDPGEEIRTQMQCRGIPDR